MPDWDNGERVGTASGVAYDLAIDNNGRSLDVCIERIATRRMSVERA